MSDELAHSYDFGPFRIDTMQRLVMRSGTKVAQTPKAFDTLLLLVRHHDRIVGKDELWKSVWPDTFVGESTLAQNIFTLRRVLNAGSGGSDDYIQTVPKRGYRFLATVTEVTNHDADAEAALFVSAGQGNSDGETISREQTIRSIAVLPMINATADPGAEYLSDGITESIINDLSQLPELQVKACSTVARYKGRDIDPQTAGRELGVGGVLIGKVLLFGESIVIRVELVDVTSGWQIWGEQYNEKPADIFKVQDEIAKHISEKLRLKLLGIELEQLFKPRTKNAEAYQFYLKGRYFLNKRTKDGYTKAIQSFEQAIQLDPAYPQAYSGLADSYLLFDFYGLIPPWETIPKARAAAMKALEIDDELAEAHNSLGSIKLVYDRDAVGAKEEFKRAIKLNPKYAHAHNGYAHCLMEMGRVEESLAECRTALELEPFDLEINQHLGWHYLFTRQYDRAIEQLFRTLEMGPDFYRARLLLGIAYGQKGAFSKAITEFHRAEDLEHTPVLSGFLGYAYAMDGKTNEARRLLKDLVEASRQSYVPPYSISLIYTGLGERGHALEWLEKAFVEHGHWRHWLKLTPEFDKLRTDDRFIQFLQRAGFDGARY